MAIDFDGSTREAIAHQKGKRVYFRAVKSAKMEEGETEGETDFWAHPLTAWLKDALSGLPQWSPRPLSYLDLCNAAILNSLLLYL